ncbi:MAG: tRNA (adenosine(37)-N6)-threonylcarbamoyltransferase complex ATPase subunit type 1 TsaE [Candidatus Calescibacterium sp.]|nr:tRNA (adenosine(37)-N6)-threonylcarbamoyltransferase complex ATPase subunit type 1 TsaE [Candidatus Calescibacterium sp.]MCX7734378.1 tRNA (adenosine(37)-N6)-threonylcarbamoyltransferase complex ATPase subunit type 1 TsaE [bacterium]MDW8086858.1 tRNA (adenosine(37)-N6)-threonylcarbamoyltransferase complex ATPase subunit type 1 TsaE [Candidatus Calescibacterium sp.]
MEKLNFSSKSTDDTKKIARQILEKVKEKFGSQEGVVFLLEGELGSGKTTLVKFFTEQISEDSHYVSSPTFTIVNEYPKKILHIDLYRVDEPDEIISFLQEKIQEDKYSAFIEWGEKLNRKIFDKTVRIKIDFGDGESERYITMEIADNL